LTEPSTVVVGATMAAGLTIFGVSTGLDAATLLAGLAGALWAQSYQEPAAWWKRCLITVLSAVIAGYLAPAISAWVNDHEIKSVLKLPFAVLVGLTAHKVLGPAALRFAAKKAEEISK